MRHPSLVSLSHDHQHGLALGLRLIQGEGALLTDGWTHEPAGQAERVIRFYRDELIPHFRAEEEVLFPAVRAAMPQQNDLIDRLMGEHRALASQVGSLRVPGGPELRPVLRGIGQLLNDHIRSEERILFPACEAGLSPEVLEMVGKKMAGMRGKEAILLVEDELEFRRLFALLLEAEGLEVLQVSDGREAFRVLEERGKDIRLVVTDMNLPGADGTLIVSRAREVAPAAKVLAMSGYGGSDLRRAAAEAGADEFLNKPFDPPLAVETVKRLLGKP